MKFLFCLFVLIASALAQKHGRGYKPVLLYDASKSHIVRDANLPASYNALEDPKYMNCRALLEVQDQEECGACFAFASTTALAARICGKFGHNISLSAQQVVDCVAGSCSTGGSATVANFYLSDGNTADMARVKGLMMGFEKGYGAVTRGCVPYEGTASESQCFDRLSDPVCKNGDDPNKRYRTDFNSVAQIQIGEGESFDPFLEELIDNGPFATSFMTYSDFDSYNSGIYRHSAQAERMEGHSIVIVGYGHDNNGELYFICQNSWGPNWGEEGYFRAYATEFIYKWFDDECPFALAEIANPVDSVDFSEYPDSSGSTLSALSILLSATLFSAAVVQ